MIVHSPLDTVPMLMAHERRHIRQAEGMVGSPVFRSDRARETAERLVRLCGGPTTRYGNQWEYAAPDSPRGYHVMRVTMKNGNVVRIYLVWLMDWRWRVAAV